MVNLVKMLFRQEHRPGFSTSGSSKTTAVRAHLIFAQFSSNVTLRPARHVQDEAVLPANHTRAVGRQRLVVTDLDTI
jgi:hypothetical protein